MKIAERLFAPVLLLALILSGCRGVREAADLTPERAQKLAAKNLLDVRADARIRRLMLEYNEAATLSSLGDLESLAPETKPSRRCALFAAALENAMLFNLVLNAPSDADARAVIRNREADLLALETEALLRRLVLLKKARAKNTPPSQKEEEYTFELLIRTGVDALPALPETLPPVALPPHELPRILAAAGAHRPDLPPPARDPAFQLAALEILNDFRKPSGALQTGLIVRKLFYLQSQRRRHAEECAELRDEITALAALVAISAETELFQQEYDTAASALTALQQSGAAPEILADAGGELAHVGCFLRSIAGNPGNRIVSAPVPGEKLEKAAQVLRRLFAEQ